MNRREFTRLAGLSTAAALLGRGAVAQASPSNPSAEKAAATATKETADQQHMEAMARYASLVGGDKVTIGMLVYPGMFLQDLVGPLAMFEAMLNREIHLVWKNREPVGHEKPEHRALVPVTPTTTFAECPRELDVLFVPGGVPGTLTMMEDPEVLAFLADRGSRARFVTSVCTGSLVLGAAGLLKGYKATSHWLTRDVLAEFGAIPTPGRIVVDRNRVTGGGVTAGLDFGLELVAQLRSKDYAEAVQLYLEYDPHPPFDSGTPEKASPLVNQFLGEMFAGLKDAASATARRAQGRLIVPAG
jgi:cyclohexyl-isocyanide hydratase